MNRHRLRLASHDLLGGIGFAAFGLFLALPHCQATAPPEPPFTVIDASDAAALLEVGPTSSPCALACANFASQTPPCREAMGNCVSVCEASRANGLLHDETIGCLKAAHDRNAIHFCGSFCP